jgi:PAS domain S-box-containing protein
VPEKNEGGLEPANFQLLINSVVDYAIYMIGLDGRVRSWNAGAARLKGYTAEEIVGRPFATFYSPEDRAAGVPQKALQTARDTGRFVAEGWRIRKDGTRFWASVVIDAIRDANGELIGFAKITRDVTDRQSCIASEPSRACRRFRFARGSGVGRSDWSLCYGVPAYRRRHHRVGV